MPKTAETVDRYRAQWGADWVKQCIERGWRQGEPDWFYAIEGGHVLGTPFTRDAALNDVLRAAVMLGSPFVCVLRPPEAVQGAPA